MLFKELILKKRLGKELTEIEINWFISNLTSNHLSEGQIAALAMAICLKGMTFEERVQLTLAMKNSGKHYLGIYQGP